MEAGHQQFRLTVKCARTNSRKKEVRARTTRTPTNRETSAHASGYTDHFRVFGATSSKDLGGIATPRKSLKRDCWDTDDEATGTPEPGQAPGITQAGVVPAPRVMTVRPLQPSTSNAVQTVIVPTQGLVNPFSKFYERPPPKRATQTTRKNPGELKMAPGPLWGGGA